MITVVIPNYNGINFIKKCLKSIPKNIPRIIVDNGSTDDSKKLAIIKNKVNLGFAAAVNQGLSQVQTSHVLVLNNDVILSKNFFTNAKLVIKQKPDYFCYCPTVMDLKNHIENTGLIFFSYGRAKHRKKNQSQEVWGAPATACVYNTKLLNKLKGFNQSFFAYIEDVDLHYRANQQSYKTYHSNKLICKHFGGATAGKNTTFRAKHTFVNWIKFIAYNYSLKEISINLPGIILERLRNLKYLFFCIANDYWHRHF